jgi:hypothetical protein
MRHPNRSSPLPLEVLRPRGAPTIGPPPLPVSRRTAELFTDMEKFLCIGKREKAGRVSAYFSHVVNMRLQCDSGEPPAEGLP